MKLLLLDQYSESGGAQQCLLELLPAMLECGWECTVGLPGEGPLVERVRELGIPVEGIECGPYESGRKSLADLARFAAGTPQLARCIGRLARPADLVYVNGPRLLPAVAWAELGRPVVFHAHSFLPPGAVRKLTGHSLRNARASVIASCEFVGAPWRPYVGNERVWVIYNGVKESPKSHLPGPPRVGCIGRIAPEKGQREFVAAAAAIHRALPDCRFAIYGAPMFASEGYAEEVRAAASNLPVEFRGWVADVYEALAELDLVLVPSAPHEATTRVILESFAAGVPVVAFRSGGIPEVVEHGTGGWLADDVEEMARLAIEYLNGPRTEASAAARENWRGRFTLDGFRREVLDFVERHARRPPAPVITISRT